MSTELITIDMDVLREMRRKGEHSKADNLLFAYQKNSEKMRVQEKKEALRIERKKRIAIGFCSTCTHHEARPGHKSCEGCITYQRKYYNTKKPRSP